MQPQPMRTLLKSWLVLMVLVIAFLFTGCGKSDIDQALDSDANGFFCPSCKVKFYTDRDVFAHRCPVCKEVGVQRVMGYVCNADQHTTLASRSTAGVSCEKCGVRTSAVMIPREVDLKAWGATKKTRNEIPQS